MTPVVQIEVTTKCNLSCFYCAGRHTQQKHMSLEVFDDILGRIAPTHKLSLQGEGEPTWHPNFWEMAAKAKPLASVLYTITNATLVDTAKLAKHFDKIGVSIDTIDPEEAERIGRSRLKDALRNLQDLIDRMGPSNVEVYTVNYGQELNPLLEWVYQLGVSHRMIPLQQKADYVKWYPQLKRGVVNASKSCVFLDTERMRFFDIDGVELPCCYIKERKDCTSREDMRERLKQGVVPECCDGCLFLRATC